MDRIHTETMMRQFPGLCVCAMENGGMTFTEDGDYVDAVDQPQDPLRDWMDFENGDGDKGHLTLSHVELAHLDDDEEEFGGDELERLMAEQRADDTDVIVSEVIGSDMGSIWPDEYLVMNGSGVRQPVRFNGNEAFIRYGTRNKCSDHNRGRKPEYKDRRKRAAGSSKTRAVNAH